MTMSKGCSPEHCLEFWKMKTVHIIGNGREKNEVSMMWATVQPLKQ